jgi:hypothetical protein
MAIERLRSLINELVYADFALARRAARVKRAIVAKGINLTAGSQGVRAVNRVRSYGLTASSFQRYL